MVVLVKKLSSGFVDLAPLSAIGTNLREGGAESGQEGLTFDLIY
jgi:hypothetical protein